MKSKTEKRQKALEQVNRRIEVANFNSKVTDETFWDSKLDKAKKEKAILEKRIKGE